MKTLLLAASLLWAGVARAEHFDWYSPLSGECVGVNSPQVVLDIMAQSDSTRAIKATRDPGNPTGLLTYTLTMSGKPLTDKLTFFSTYELCWAMTRGQPPRIATR